MKLNTLLEDEELQQKLRKGALELQAYLLDLEHIDLDVELINRGSDAIEVEYHDANRLVAGTVHLSTKVTPGGGLIYQASTVGAGIIQTGRDGFATAMILFKMFRQDLPFKAFEQAVVSAFGTTNVTVEDKARLPKNVVFGVTLAPPFKLEHGKSAMQPLMVHNQKIVQHLSVRITSTSTVQIGLLDSNGDLTYFEGPSIVSTFPRMREFIIAAQETL